MFIKIDDQIINLDMVLKFEEINFIDEFNHCNTTIGFTIIHYGGEKTHVRKIPYNIWAKENNFSFLGANKELWEEWIKKASHPDFQKELEPLIAKRDEIIQKLNDLIVGSPSEIIKIDF